jgi:hypothetical protein
VEAAREARARLRAVAAWGRRSGKWAAAWEAAAARWRRRRRRWRRRVEGQRGGVRGGGAVERQPDGPARVVAASPVDRVLHVRVPPVLPPHLLDQHRHRRDDQVVCPNDGPHLAEERGLHRERAARGNVRVGRLWVRMRDQPERLPLLLHMLPARDALPPSVRRERKRSVNPTRRVTSARFQVGGAREELR